MALFHEVWPEWYRTQKSCKTNFRAGRGICANATSRAEKFTLGSRICLGGTGYSWPGLFSKSLQRSFEHVEMMISFELTNIYLYRYLLYARFGVILRNNALFYRASKGRGCGKPPRTTRSVAWAVVPCKEWKSLNRSVPLQRG